MATAADALSQLALDYALGGGASAIGGANTNVAAHLGAAMPQSNSGGSELQRVSAEVRERRQRRTFKPSANWWGGSVVRTAAR